MAIMYNMKLLVSWSGVVLTFISMWYLMIFLSYFPTQEDTPTSGGNLIYNLCVDVTLLCMFILQHSFMAHPTVKNVITSGAPHLERSLYIIMSSLAIQLLIFYWKPISWVSLWHVNLIDSKIVWWLFTLIHLYMWSIIYTGSIMTDPIELLGIKQVVYSTNDMHPFPHKSQKLMRFYQHMRHPSFVGFSIILWICPYMRLDRLLLSLTWTLYMLIMWNVDNVDYQYVKEKHFQKKALWKCDRYIQ